MSNSPVNPETTPTHDTLALASSSVLADGAEAVSAVPTSPRKKRPVKSITGVLVLAVVTSYWYWPRPEVDAELRQRRIDESQAEVVAPVDSMSPEDRAFATKVIGTWFQEEYGKKTLTIMPDGKGLMLMEPSALFAMAFGSRVEATMYWSIKDGYIDYGINSGTPADKIEMAKKSFGDFWHEKIVQLDDDTLILIEIDNDRSAWKRLPDQPTSEDNP